MVARFAQAGLPALVLTDLVLVDKMRWPFPVPLLMSKIGHTLLRVGEPRQRPRPGQDDWPRTVATAYVPAASAAVDLAAALVRRADAFLTTAPRLRAKGAGEIVAALPEDDALTPASAPNPMSEHA